MDAYERKVHESADHVIILQQLVGEGPIQRNLIGLWYVFVLCTKNME